MKQDKKQLSLNELAGKGYKFAVISIDETEYWRDDLKKLAGRIDCVYLINLKEPTHLCELAISYPAIFLKNFVPNTDGFPDGIEDEDLQAIETDTTGGEETRYFSGNSIFKVHKLYRRGSEQDIEEYERCNPSVC